MIVRGERPSTIRSFRSSVLWKPPSCCFCFFQAAPWLKIIKHQQLEEQKTEQNNRHDHYKTSNIYDYIILYSIVYSNTISIPTIYYNVPKKLKSTNKKVPWTLVLNQCHATSRPWQTAGKEAPWISTKRKTSKQQL